MTTTTWHAQAWQALHALAHTGEPFTSDDLLDRVGAPDHDHEPNGRNSAIGSMFRQAAAEGWITTEGRVVKSRAPHRKGGAVRIWVGVHIQPSLFGDDT